MKDLAIVGVGNILEKDDGIAIYATSYLEQNYRFEPEIDIINGGVEGIDLLNLFMEYKHLIILDAIDIDDEAGSIYAIPSDELRGYGLNSGGAHEIGVLECLDMIELMGKEIPRSTLLGIIPQTIEVEIALSDKLYEKFDSFIDSLIDLIKKEGFNVKPNSSSISLPSIIEGFRNPKSFI